MCILQVDDTCLLTTNMLLFTVEILIGYHSVNEFLCSMSSLSRWLSLVYVKAFILIQVVLWPWRWYLPSSMPILLLLTSSVSTTLLLKWLFTSRGYKHLNSRLSIIVWPVFDETLSMAPLIWPSFPLTNLCTLPIFPKSPQFISEPHHLQTVYCLTYLSWVYNDDIPLTASPEVVQCLVQMVNPST